MLLAFIHAATYITTRGRYISSPSKRLASYYFVFKSSLTKWVYSIFSAVSSASCYSAITPYRVSVLAMP